MLGPSRSPLWPGDWASTLLEGSEDPGLPCDLLWPSPPGDLRLRPLSCVRPLPAAPCGSLCFLCTLTSILTRSGWPAGCRSQESRSLSLCDLEGQHPSSGGHLGVWAGLGWTGKPDPPSLRPQRSFTLIVEAWDWDNDTTPDGESAPGGPRGAACRHARSRAPGAEGTRQGAASALQGSAVPSWPWPPGRSAALGTCLCCPCSDGGPASPLRARTWAVPSSPLTSC